MATKSSKSHVDTDDRVYHVMRFTPEDKQIMKDHLARFSSWAAALDALVPVVEAMVKEAAKVKAPKRKAMRLGLSKKFTRAAKKLKGRPMTETIIVAAKRFAAEHPIHIRNR